MAEKCSSLVRNCPSCGAKVSKIEVCACGADLHCDNYAVPGYKYCANHGGPAPSRDFYGIGRGMTDGKKSSFPLTRLAAKYNEMQRNGVLLSNRNAMDIIWMRVQELAKRIDMNEAPERMSNIQKLWKSYRSKQDSGDELEAKLVAIKLDAEFEAAYHDYMSWQQMFSALELHAKMTESEVKIAKDMRAIMTAEDAYELVAKVMAVMLKVLRDDPKRLKEAQFELSALVGDSETARNRSTVDIDESSFE